MFSEENIHKRSRIVSVNPYFFIIAFLKKKKIPIEEFTKFIGEKLALTWNDAKDITPNEFAKFIALDYAALGADKFTYEGDDKEAIVEIDEWPNPNLLAFWEVTLEDVDQMNTINKPIYDFLGFTREYKRVGSKMTFKIKK
jgi:hypothetical protein